VNATFFAVLQDQTGEATLSLFSLAGEVIRTSSLHFVFRFPLVEATADPVQHQIYLVAFPNSEPGAVLYILDEQLNVASTIKSPDLIFFDLQYSTSQNAIYGIAVNGTYGRVLSNFTIGSTITAQPIAALPYMWFVNASTYDLRNNRYFGLLKNFVQQPNATDAQKLAVGSFSNPLGPTVFVDLDTELIIYFIAWSDPAQTLYGLAAVDDVSVTFVTIDVITGAVARKGSPIPMATVGPIFASPTEPALFAWLHINRVGRVYGRFDITENRFGALNTYRDDIVVAAVAPAWQKDSITLSNQLNIARNE